VRVIDSLSLRSDVRCAAVTVGVFDGLHLGHRAMMRALIEEAKACGCASCAVTFSNHPVPYFKPDLSRPLLCTPNEKLFLLAQAGVDATVMIPFDEKIAPVTAAEFLDILKEALGIRALVTGYDNLLGSDLLGEDGLAPLCQERGIRLRHVPAVKVGGVVVHSTLIRRAIERQDFGEAAAYLGGRYFLIGTVERGLGIGAEMLGCPTANLTVRPDKLLPPDGVYACVAEWRGNATPAAVNVMPIKIKYAGHESEMPASVAAAVGANSRGETRIVEAHIFAEPGEMYGEELRVSFVKAVRPLIRFDDADALKTQIHADIIAIKAMGITAESP
jgi:riboflavin kinase/FMN adenylyltransferase